MYFPTPKQPHLSGAKELELAIQREMCLKPIKKGYLKEFLPKGIIEDNFY